jgi:transposase|tara:strand:- start:162 stop:479 length:318 start_codon:yes stop_codon:yes gene_type:complete
MTRKRRTFTPEFKQEAASLVLDQGYSITQASLSLGVVESVLRKWVKQLTEERQGVTPKGKAMTPEQQRIQELEERCRRLEMEKTILKNSLPGAPRPTRLETLPLR